MRSRNYVADSLTDPRGRPTVAPMKKLLLSALIVASASVAATTSTTTVAHADAYGTAGCGLGSILFGAKPGIVQVFAATTNGFFGTQTFGITSGTSNCGGQAVTVVAAKQFIETNREAFAKDVSRGSGETITTLASIGGCSDSAAVAVSLQRNFKTIFPAASATNTAVGNAAVTALKSDKALVCTKLI